MLGRRKEHILAINNILRESSTSLSRLRLFDQHQKHLSHHSSPQRNNTRLQKYYYQIQQQNAKEECPQCHSRIQKYQQTSDYNQAEDPPPPLKMKQSHKRLSVPETTKGVYTTNPQMKRYSSSFKQTHRSKGDDPLSKQKVNITRYSNLGKSIRSIPYEAVKSFFIQNSSFLQTNADSHQIYAKLNPFCQGHQVYLLVPLIKQYRNCTYFGEPIVQQQMHQGFLIFINNSKIYYGELVNQKKCGRGIEIDLLNDIVYSGNYEHGRKVGEFTVIKANEKYIGGLKNNNYDGEGKLFTQNSIYRGQFKEGCRHGEGQELYPETGLSISGTFIYNSFTNNPERIEQSRIGTFKSKQMNKKPSAIKYKNRDNPEQQKASKVNFSPHSFQEFNFEMERSKNSSLRQTKWNKGHKFRISQAQRSCGRKDIQEEDPLRAHS